MNGSDNSGFSTVSTLFMAEGRCNLNGLLAELVALFDREEDKQAVSLLINWFRQMAVHKRIRQEDYLLLEYEQTVYEKGREDGLEEGIEVSQAKIVLAIFLTVT
ncbi:MAG: hypothetical protein KJZ86_08685 [Caldilineaceae bacterium]|nr:hypothetical protein [Caldilineaceae bacterium]